MDTLFTPESVVADLQAMSHKQLFQDLAQRLLAANKLEHISCRDVVSATVERERLGSTGVGNGVALPHARIDGLDRVVAGFARLETPLDFDAVDERPVDLVVMLLAPADSAGAHLRALARVSRQLRREDNRARLRNAPDAQSLYHILSDEEARATAA